jgi:hypothetical protein
MSRTIVRELVHQQTGRKTRCLHSAPTHGYGATPEAARAASQECTSRQHVKSWFGATSCRRAIKLTVVPGSNVSSTVQPLAANDPEASLIYWEALAAPRDAEKRRGGLWHLVIIATLCRT